VTGGVGSATVRGGVCLVGWADADRLPHRPRRCPGARRLWFPERPARRG
jgi:hypothetical protein